MRATACVHSFCCLLSRETSFHLSNVSFWSYNNWIIFHCINFRCFQRWEYIAFYVGQIDFSAEKEPPAEDSRLEDYLSSELETTAIPTVVNENSHSQDVVDSGFSKDLPKLTILYWFVFWIFLNINLTIVFSVSCGYKQAFNQFYEFAKEKYPGLVIEGGNFSPDFWKGCLAQVLSINHSK